VKRSCLLILLAAVIVLSCASDGTAYDPSPSATPPSQRQSTAEQKSAGTQSQQTKNPSTPTNALSEPTPNRLAENHSATAGQRDTTEEQRHDRREEGLEGKLVRLTGILAVANVVTGVIFLFTMFATIRAANAAKRSADALALTERAFVLFADTVSPDPRNTAEFTYWVRNSGNSPAYIKIIRACVRLGAPVSGGIPRSLRDPSGSYKTAVDIAVLGPDQGFGALESIGPSDYVDPSVVDQIRRKERTLWFWGFVAYVDAFGEEHITEWCRFWKPSEREEDWPPEGIWVFVDEPGRNIAT